MFKLLIYMLAYWFKFEITKKYLYSIFIMCQQGGIQMMHGDTLGATNDSVNLQYLMTMKAPLLWGLCPILLWANITE